MFRRQTTLLALSSVVISLALWLAALATLTTPDQHPIPHHELFANVAALSCLVQFGIGVAVLIVGMQSKRRGERWNFDVLVGVLTCLTAILTMFAGVMLSSGHG